MRAVAAAAHARTSLLEPEGLHEAVLHHGLALGTRNVGERRVALPLSAATVAAGAVVGVRAVAATAAATPIPAPAAISAAAAAAAISAAAAALLSRLGAIPGEVAFLPTVVARASVRPLHLSRVAVLCKVPLLPAVEAGGVAVSLSGFTVVATTDAEEASSLLPMYHEQAGMAPLSLRRGHVLPLFVRYLLAHRLDLRDEALEDVDAVLRVLLLGFTPSDARAVGPAGLVPLSHGLTERPMSAADRLGDRRDEPRPRDLDLHGPDLLEVGLELFEVLDDRLARLHAGAGVVEGVLDAVHLRVAVPQVVLDPRADDRHRVALLADDALGCRAVLGLEAVLHRGPLDLGTLARVEHFVEELVLLHVLGRELGRSAKHVPLLAHDHGDAGRFPALGLLDLAEHALEGWHQVARLVRVGLQQAAQPQDDLVHLLRLGILVHHALRTLEVGLPELDEGHGVLRLLTPLWVLVRPRQERVAVVLERFQRARDLLLLLVAALHDAVGAGLLRLARSELVVGDGTACLHRDRLRPRVPGILLQLVCVGVSHCTPVQLVVHDVHPLLLGERAGVRRQRLCRVSQECQAVR